MGVRSCGSHFPEGAIPLTKKLIELLICDDHKILTDALAAVVDRDPALHMSSPPAHSPQDAIELARKHQPDVVLMDIYFRGPMNGIEATRAIKEVSPATKVIVMTAHEEDRLLVEAVESGASGFLGKSEAADEVLSAVKSAADGEVLIEPATMTRLLRKVARQRKARREAAEMMGQLTDRERDVLQLLAEGKRNEEIARELDIKPFTVQTHVRNMLSKLNVHSKLEAVAYAVKNGGISV
jgi:DNA-binding NarL/FixJ family response regulator